MMETHSRLPGLAEVTTLSYFGRVEEVEPPAKNVERTGILARLICGARFCGLDLRVPRKESLVPQVAQRLKIAFLDKEGGCEGL
jgi:hypothetical protein